MELEEKTLSQEEINRARVWAEANKNSVPPEVYKALILIVHLQEQLSNFKQKSTNLLRALRQAMGITPQSERGTRTLDLEAPIDDGPEPVLPPELEALKKERNRLTRQLNRYTRRVNHRRKKPTQAGEAPQPKKVISLGLETPEEKLFSGSLGDFCEEQKGMEIERLKHFDRSKGLHSSSDKRTRYEYQLQTKRIILNVETVTDPLTGKSVTASTDEVGPPGYQVTWKGISNTIVAVMGYAIPLNRLATMLSATCPYFTSGRICGILNYAAELCEPIYQHSGESLSDSGTLAGDDTTTRVLEMERELKSQDGLEVKPGISARLAEVFGRISLIKSKKRAQKRLNVSVVIGKTNPDDRRSYVFFFRTHVGHLGNLLSQILKMRLPKHKKLVIQSDLSSSNHVDKELYKIFQIEQAGCTSHARRPFWRYRSDDPPLCYWMLNAFLTLERIEDRLNEFGRTEKRVLYYRQKFAKKVWAAIKVRCESVMRGETIHSFLWPKTSAIYLACQYIVIHYKELTLYLDDPRLWSTTNLCERLLRWDKIMIDASGFRSTERGRINVDILRTILHTCSAAEVELEDYLFFVFKNRDKIKLNPDQFTPYAFALLKNGKLNDSGLACEPKLCCPSEEAVESASLA